jgi:hypothetical protein
MSDEQATAAVAKLRIALEMFGLGESMMRQNLRRAYPAASESEIEAKLSAWLRERPGAEFGDAPGKIRSFEE